jgi:electron transfer flavoprotein beta subunit
VAVNVAVLVKYVPSPQGTPTLGPDNLLVRSGVEGSLDPGDEYGLEAALQIVEAGGGEVTAMSMGPDEASAAIQRALAMGAHKGVLVTDPALRGADVLITARVLAAAIRAAGPFELIIGGVESTDGYTGTLPSTLAELLDLPSVTFARKIAIEDGEVRAERQTETGYDVVVSPLPALVTVTSGANEPRYPSLKGIMSAKQKPVDRLTAADLGLSGEELTSSQSVVAVTEATGKSAGEILQAGPDVAARIADLLAEAKAI